MVKELIENSIDAESTEIRIEILRGGKGLIKVVDNGIGMDGEDALLCLQRHATSKLRNEKIFSISPPWASGARHCLLLPQFPG